MSDLPAAGTRAFGLSFLGATGTVTGSKYLVEAAGKRILIDCGLFQGYKALRLRNWNALPIAPAHIDAVVLTHAHLDHSGYLPLLVQQGFRGPVHCTAATRALCELLLPDSGHLLEEEAAFANRRGYSKHRPALPLYTEAQARASLRHLQAVEFDRPLALAEGLTATLRGAGHILGAASIVLEHAGARLTFSGDLGRPHDPVMRAPAALEATDVLVVESTYGDRKHAVSDPEAELAPVLSRVAARGGVVVIPAFAIGRAQSLLHSIARMKVAGSIPAGLPIYLNSPMAIDATELYHQFRQQHRLTAAECERMCRVATLVNSVEASKALNGRHGPMVIISASGMATGGRVLHHLQAFAPDPRNAIVLAGYQAGGTRGAALAGGARSVRVFGADVAVNAEVVQLGSASAHADADEILAWLKTAPRAPRQVFITHGEPAAADALRLRIARELGWDCTVPDYRDQVDVMPVH